jgi:hypothetical protein
MVRTGSQPRDRLSRPGKTVGVKSRPKRPMRSSPKPSLPYQSSCPKAVPVMIPVTLVLAGLVLIAIWDGAET